MLLKIGGLSIRRWRNFLYLGCLAWVWALNEIIWLWFLNPCHDVNDLRSVTVYYDYNLPVSISTQTWDKVCNFSAGLWKDQNLSEKLVWWVILSAIKNGHDPVANMIKKGHDPSQYDMIYPSLIANLSKKVMTLNPYLIFQLPYPGKFLSFPLILWTNFALMWWQCAFFKEVLRRLYFERSENISNFLFNPDGKWLKPSIMYDYFDKIQVVIYWVRL